MRIALISDTHGNAVALESVMTDMQSQKVDRIIFLGDALTIGCQPKETLEIIKGLHCICIMGNHDSAVLKPKRAAQLQIASNLHASLDWCAQQMTSADLNFLHSFLPSYELQLTDNLSALFFHGSPLSNTDLIISTTPPEAIDAFFEGQTASIWAGGHSHIQMLRRHGDKLILNPGSVGNAFYHAFTPGTVPRLLPWAEYAILNVEKGAARSRNNQFTVEMRRVSFDTQEVLRLAAASDFPSKDWWLEQYT